MKAILLAHWNGRFGNRMHQYAYGATYAKLNNCQFILPSDWEGSFLFKKQVHEVLKNDDLRLHINQSQRGLDTIQYREQNIKRHYPGARQINPEDPNDCYSVHDDLVYFDCMCAYKQFVFDRMSKSYIKDIFEFSDEVKNLDIYKRLEDGQGKDIVAHLRRDDICNLAITKTGDVGYSTVSLDSYKRAFKKFGVDYNEVKWVTDDRSLNIVPKTQEVKLGWSYPVGAHKDDKIGFDFLEDFLKIYFAKKVFRANSSFSWWASFLSNAEIYSPILGEKVVYGYPDLVEIEVDFEEGNEHHWMHYCDKILMND